MERNERVLERERRGGESSFGVWTFQVRVWVVAPTPRPTAFCHFAPDMADDHDYPHQVEVDDEEYSDEPTSSDVESSDVALQDEEVEQIVDHHHSSTPAHFDISSAIPTAANSHGKPKHTHVDGHVQAAARHAMRQQRSLDVEVEGPTEDVRGLESP